jgi:cell division protein FtsL
MTDKELAEEYRWYIAALEVAIRENDELNIDRADLKIETTTEEIVRRFLERAEEEDA